MDAMKMQTTVYAPIDGTIKEIAVNPRDTVEARDLLVTIE
jgi:pyruvate carboxylase